MWNAWTAPPGALPRDYDPWSCEAHCARCGELAQDCHCDEDDMSDQQRDWQAAYEEEYRIVDRVWKSVRGGEGYRGEELSAIVADYVRRAETFEAEAKRLKEWQPIASAPEGRDVLVFWPRRKYDENEMPTGEIVGGLVVVSSRTGESWEERDNAFEASGHDFGDDYEFAEAPTHWMPIPAAPDNKQPEEERKS